MEIMDGPHGQTSTVVTSQLPTDQWYASIDDNTLADAILDRLMHNAHRLQLKRKSMRKILSQLTEDAHINFTPGSDLIHGKSNIAYRKKYRFGFSKGQCDNNPRARFH
jgi:hypothetical protein